MRRNGFPTPPRPRGLCGAVLSAALWAGQALSQGLPPSEAATALARLSAGAPGAAAPAATRAPLPRRTAVPFVLREVRFTGPSGYVPTKRLQQVVAGFIGRQMHPAEVGAIADAVTAFYRAEGIDLAQGQLAGVDPSRGVVTIRPFEARLGQLDYSARQASPAYLDYRLGLRPGDLADTRAIARRLERLTMTDGVLVDAAFAPGAAAGETDLALSLQEQPATSTVLRLDNYGDAATGEARALLSFRLNSLSGWNDPLAMDLLASEGSRSATLSYARTVTPSGGRLGVALSAERTRNVSGPRRRSDTRSMTLSYNHPLLLETQAALWATAALDVYEERVRTVGVVTANQSGWSLALGLSGSLRAPDRPLRQAGWSLGLTLGQFDDAVRGLDGLSHQALLASGRLEWSLADRAYAVLSAAAQLPLTDETPSRGQFAITSPYAVPGYPSGMSEGDGGYWARVQIETAQALPLRWADLRPYVLGAVGEAWDRGPGGRAWQGLASSAGVGLSGLVADKASFDLTLAKPFTRVLGQGGRDDWSLHAALPYRF